ncbi:M48 family metalloprotease [Brevundimonas sp.]|jgi:predicted Zn-dependent protease|uniref:M48 family metalloprotease n=1 Tax=Brevundimonas sp. TaxID=1871086 RepID=UPI002624BC8B|nr:M48 family metalloprotease [Brevundimonas sp.]
MSPFFRTAARLGAVLCAAAATALWPQAAAAQSLIRDTEIEGIIHEWSAPVFVAMGLEPDEVTILLVNDQSLNAFATRGRIMGLNTGLILRTRSPNELLGVIAHEGGHIKNRHTLRDGAQNAGMQPFLMTMALGALAAIAGAPDAAAVLMANSQYFGTLSALRYMQGQEGEADITAARALEAAGISGRGLMAFFENFRSQEVFSEARRFPYFRSHPLSSQRIEQLRPYVTQASSYNVPDDPIQVAQHALVLAKIHAFMEPPAQTLRKYPASDVSYPARYARAIAWYKNGETDRALAAVEELLAEQPENPFLWELKGQILFEEGRAQDAVAAHSRAVELLPDAPLLHINLAHALLESGQSDQLDEAIDHLKRATVLESDNTLAWRLLGQAYARQGKEGEARLASAEYYFAMGQQQQATQFALRARDMLEPSTVEWRRAMDIVLASGATMDDIRILDEDTRRRTPGVIPPSGR